MNAAQSSSTGISETDKQNYIVELLTQKLPKIQAINELKDAGAWSFTLTTRPPKKQRVAKKKKLFLTRNERKRLEVLKLPKDGWKHAHLEGMRQLWGEYMMKNLSLYGKNGKIPKIEDANWSNFNVTLSKCEFIGAELTVVRSKVVNQIGMTGTVVFETKSTFQIVTVANELKTLIKKPSVFSFVLGNTKFTIFGKHMGIRPSERSVKKLKSHFLPDL